MVMNIYSDEQFEKHHLKILFEQLEINKQESIYKTFIGDLNMFKKAFVATLGVVTGLLVAAILFYSAVALGLLAIFL